MTTRYHISDDNVPRVCVAKPGNCGVRGEGTKHFANLSEAYSYTALKRDTIPQYALNHEEEIKKINTRFYAFRGAWGDQQMILVDTELGWEYDLKIKDDEDAGERIQQAAEFYARTTRKGMPKTIEPNHNKLGYNSRQCFNRGIGYSEVPLPIEQHPSYVSKKRSGTVDPNLHLAALAESARVDQAGAAKPQRVRQRTRTTKVAQS